MLPRMTDTYREIVDPADPLLDSFWFPLYRRAFPDDERVAEDDHRAAVADPDRHVLVALDDGRPVAIARYDVFSESLPAAFAYLMYMAVDERSVSRGHGQQIFGEVVRRLTDDPAAPRVIVFEVQQQAESNSPEHHQLPDRRIAFYRRQGSTVLGGVEYVQHVPGHAGVPMLIMARPLGEGVLPVDVFVAARHLFDDDVRQTSDLVLSADSSRPED